MPDRPDHQNEIDNGKNSDDDSHIAHLLGKAKHQLILPMRGSTRKFFMIESGPYDSVSGRSVIDIDERVIGELRKISIFGYSAHCKYLYRLTLELSGGVAVHLDGWLDVHCRAASTTLHLLDAA